MKYYRFYLLFILLIGAGGCNFLNYDESSDYTKNDIFSNFDRTKSFLTNIYSHLPDGFNSIDGAMRASATDEAEEVWDLSNVQKFNDGSWSAIQTLDTQWSNMYSGIRAVNLFLKESKGNTFEERKYNDDYDQMMEQYKIYPYEARFLRAYFYFELIRRYGHVPLITSVLEADQANSIQPASFDEVASFIVNECDDIMNHLPVNYANVPNKETGRATRGAAMALKARTLLYAASKLHNPDGSLDKWKEAAAASEAIIDSSWYSLANNYSNVVNNYKSNELILGRRLGTSNSFEKSNFPIGYEGANPGTCPTQNLVDAYEMQSTGESITAQGSGYDPVHPYTDRDPRLAKTVIINNSQWKGQNVEIWDGGRNAPPLDRATKTGYYLKKYVIESVNLDPTHTTQKEHTWVLFRYGEVLLNYAEAMNEAYGPEDPANLGMTAREAVNMIRNRANMPDFPTGLTQDQFRKKLRNERMVELAFENHRFWDIRRWMIGPSTTDIYGMDIKKNNDGSFSYHKKLVEKRAFEDKMYLYPIPESEILKNGNLNQNPGW